MKTSSLSLLSDFANASDELLKLKIIRTDSFTGEIGEYIACNHFKLVIAKKVAKEVDAMDTEGNHYQIKANHIINNNNIKLRLIGDISYTIFADIAI